MEEIDNKSDFVCIEHTEQIQALQLEIRRKIKKIEQNVDSFKTSLKKLRAVQRCQDMIKWTLVVITSAIIALALYDVISREFMNQRLRTHRAVGRWVSLDYVIWAIAFLCSLLIGYVSDLYIDDNIPDCTRADQVLEPRDFVFDCDMCGERYYYCGEKCLHCGAPRLEDDEDEEVDIEDDTDGDDEEDRYEDAVIG